MQKAGFLTMRLIYVKVCLKLWLYCLKQNSTLNFIIELYLFVHFPMGQSFVSLSGFLLQDCLKSLSVLQQTIIVKIIKIVTVFRVTQ